MCFVTCTEFKVATDTQLFSQCWPQYIYDIHKHLRCKKSRSMSCCFLPALFNPSSVNTNKQRHRWAFRQHTIGCAYP